jgi:hypothetical protein
VANKFDYNESVITRRRTGTIDDPYVELTESHQVFGNIVSLREIPNKQEKVVVKGGNITWVEKEKGIPSPTQFVVDYEDGLVTFHESNNGKQLQFEYKGTGLRYIPIKMIYTRQEDGEILETLNDIVEAGRDSIENLKDVNATIENAETAIDNANTAATNANSKATLAQNKIDLLTGLETDINQSIIDSETATTNAATAANNANTKATEAQTQANYAKEQGDRASQLIGEIEGSAGVTSVNGKQGSVTLDANSVGAIPASEKGVINGVATLGEDGKVPQEQLNIQPPEDASLTVKGLVSLSSSTSSISETEAATPKAVKEVYDLANGKANTNIATETENGLMSSAQVSKLNNIADNANNYVHPTNHPASIITQDTNNRFVSDQEKTTWNNKENQLNANQKRVIYVQSTTPTSPQEGDIWIEV